MVKEKKENTKNYYGFREIPIVLTSIVSVFTAIGLVLGGYIFLDQRYALASSLVKVELKVAGHEMRHLYHEALNDVFFFRKQSRLHPEDPAISRKLRVAQEDAESIKIRLEKIKSMQAEGV